MGAEKIETAERDAPEEKCTENAGEHESKGCPTAQEPDLIC